VAFSDLEMQAIMEAAANLDQEKRSVFLMRVAAIRNLKHTSGIDAVISRALQGLRQGDVQLKSDA
jgi:hypothetical protein